MQQLTAISGVGEKGPACFLYTSGTSRLLLDLGRGPDFERLPDLSGITGVNAIVFSHGHVDHTGGLTLWDTLGRPPLFATAPTIALARKPELQQATSLDRISEICGISIETGACGHAPGAVWMRLNGADGLVYTGDCSLESQLYQSTLPPAARALVFDASYGISDTPLATQIREIETAICEPVLLPAPAGGRGLEMACHFLDRGHAVSICPDHYAVAQTLLDYPAWLTSDGLDALERLLARGETLHPDTEPSGIMIAAGPNAERGVAQQLARSMLRTGRGQIIFTGHVASGTPSASMIETGRASFMRWNVHPPLHEQAKLMKAICPEQVLAAFAPKEAIDKLRETTGWPIANGRTITW